MEDGICEMRLYFQIGEWGFGDVIHRNNPFYLKFSHICVDISHQM